MQLLVNYRNNTLALTALSRYTVLFALYKNNFFWISVYEQSSCLQRDSQKTLRHSSSICSRSFVLPVLWGHGYSSLAFEIPHPNLHMLWELKCPYTDSGKNCELALWKLILLTFIPSVTQRQWIFCASHEHSLLPFPLAAELLPAFLFCSITITFFLFQENWTNWPKLGFFSMPWLSLWLMKSKTSLNHIAQFFRMKLPLPIAQ